MGRGQKRFSARRRIISGLLPARGLRRISLLGTAVALLLLTALLVSRRDDRKDGRDARSKPGAVQDSMKVDTPDFASPVSNNAGPKTRMPERNAPPAPEKKATRMASLDSIAGPIAPTGSPGPDRFVLRDRNVGAFFTDRGVTLALMGPREARESNGHALHWGLDGAKAAEPRPSGELPTKINRFVGNPSTWQSNVSTYSKVIYDDVKPGVDLVVESKPHALKYTLEVEPGADIENLKFRYEGAHDVQVNKDGTEVHVLTNAGVLIESELICWQDGPAGRVPVTARYAPSGRDGYVIEVGEFDRERALVIDPMVAWGTFLGGSMGMSGGDEYGYGIAVDSAYNVYVGGYTQAVNFPATAGAFDLTHSVLSDGFVSKFNAGGGLVWSTYLGGDNTDTLRALRIDSSANVYVTGYTYSSNFPTTAGAFRQSPTPGSSSEVFVTKLSGVNSSLIWSTYLGGTSSDFATAIAVDSTSNAYVTGYTLSTNFPTAGTPAPFDSTQNGSYDVFVTKINSSGTGLIWSTFLGGTSSELGQAIAVDIQSTPNVYVTGYTSSTNFPTTAGSYDTISNGSNDVFVTKLSPDGSALDWSTYIGGNSVDEAFGIALEAAAVPDVFITGRTYDGATDYPTSGGAFDPTHNGGYDVFVTKISRTGNNLGWSTFIGGTGTDYGYGIAVNSSSNEVYISGYTSSSAFPMHPWAYDSTYNVNDDAFIAKFTAQGNALYYSTFLGGSSTDQAFDIAERAAYVWVTGRTASPGFPTTAGAYDTILGGTADAFVSRFDTLINGVGSLLWSTYLGGANGPGSSYGEAVGGDSSGNIYVAGRTNSIDFPVTAGSWDTTYNGTTSYYDITVTKIDFSGSFLVWSTYLGGAASDDFAQSMAVNSAGEAFITGYTYSSDFPTTVTAYDKTLGGGADSFVTKLKADGTGLVYSTFLGGTLSSEYGSDIAVDASDFAYVTGTTYSSDYPITVGAADITFLGGGEAFVTKVNPSGSGLAWSTFLGGDAGGEDGIAIAVDGAGAVYVTGMTYSSDFPVTAGAFDTSYDFINGEDPYVAKIKADGSGLHWASFLGGNAYEYPSSIAVDSAGSAYVAGNTGSADFPVPGGFQTLLAGSDDGFVAKFMPSGSDLIWSTFLGGASTDQIYDVALDSNQNVYVTGATWSLDFPVTPHIYTSSSGSADAFVSRLDASGSILSWSTYLGGTGWEAGYGIVVSSEGHLAVTGETSSLNFPVTGGAFSTALSGNSDIFVFRIDNEPPTDPSGLSQHRSNGITVIPTFGATNETTVVLKGISSDAEGEDYKLQIEIRPILIALTSPSNVSVDNVVFFESSPVPSGVTASVTVSGRTSGVNYHWQARSIDVNGVASGWVGYGFNAENPPSVPAATDFQIDQSPPGITILSPTAGATYSTNAGTVALGGTASDNVSVFSVTWSNAATGGNGTASGTGSWNVASISLAPGSNVITVVAQDSAGNTANDVINVIYDPTPPGVTITSPTSNPTHVTATSPLTTLAGTASDNIAVTSVTWTNVANSTSGTATGTVNWSVSSITLVSGINTIDVRAFDAAGNITLDSISVTHDPTPPLVTITVPTSASTYMTSAGTVTLGGTASDTLSAVTLVSWNNTTTGGSGTAGGTTNWTTPPIPLAAGSNVINVTATDSAGNTSQDSITVISDSILPSVTINSPTTNPTHITNVSSIALGGVASDTGGAGLSSVTWANSATGGNGTASGTSSWSVGSIALVAGSNAITVTATDAAGNASNDLITVSYDPTPPSVTIQVPTTFPTYFTANASIGLSGIASDNILLLQVDWRNNGGLWTPASGTTSWSVASVGLVAGNNVIDVRATDTAGNTFIDTITVTRDNTPPSVSITTPSTDPFYTSGSAIALAGTASDVSGISIVEWRNNGGLWNPASGTTSWSVPSVPLVAGTNTIDVRATDFGSNTAIDTTIVIRDNTPPGILITTSGGLDFATNATPLALAGTASDNALVSLIEWSNNGGPFSAASGTTSWSASIPLAAGSNTITVRVTDGAGNLNTDSIIVTLDQTNPVVTITVPTSLPTFFTSVTPIGVSGTSSDNVSVFQVHWQVNGGGFTLAAGTTSWSVASIPLNPGANTIDVRATDTAGNTFIDTIIITRDNTPPAVLITTPSTDPFYTQVSSLPFAGTSSDASGISAVEWRNNAGAWFPVSSGTTSWTITGITMVAGNNLVEVRATDLAGNTAIDATLVIRDNAPPGVVITTSGGLDFAMNATPTSLAGTASDNNVVSLIEWSNNGGPFNPASGTTSWTASVTLAAGTNTVTIRATDAAGNTATDSIIVTLDQTNPVVTITGPTSNPTFTTAAASIPLSGTSSDNVSVFQVHWQINGGGFSNLASGTTSWTIASVSLNAGANTIDVRATDTAGNTFIDTITVTRDNTPPAVLITTPATDPFYTTGSSIALAGTASDNTSITQVEWRVTPPGGGFSPASGTTSWSVASVPLTAGSNTIEVRATDAGGNTSLDTTVVIRDNTPPAVDITTNSGADFTTNVTPLALAGTSSDNFVVSLVQWSNNGGVFNNATGTTSWSASIPLAAGTNAITVRSTDAAGNTAIDTITVTYDSGAPSITIQTPTTNPTFITNGATLTTLGGVASDSSGISAVHWRNNGGLFTNLASGTTTWTVASIPLVVGTNTIDVRATDTGLNTSIDTIVVTLDQTAPVVVINSPTSNPTYSTNVSTIALSGTVSDTGGGTVTSVSWFNAGNSQSGGATLFAGGWSIASIPLVTGSQLISITATDSAGNTSNDTITVTLDTTIPTVSVTTPTSPHVRNATPVPVTGSAGDVGGSGVASVSWSRAEGGGATGAASGTTSWSASVPLVVGTNTITFTSTDGAGNVSLGAVLIVTLDQTGPAVAITGPTSNPTYSTNASTIALNGTVSDSGGGTVSTVTWFTTGAVVPNSGGASLVGGTWSIATIDLATGSQVITVTATDSVGNTSNDTITVILDTTPPTVSLSTPTSPHIRNTTPVPVTGTAGDVGGSGVASVNWSRAEGGGATGAATGTTSWSASVPLVVGTNTITFTSTDGAGNVSTTPAVLIVTLDQTPPGISISVPTSNPTHSTGTTPLPTLSGSSSDNTSVSQVDWQINGGGYAPAGGTTSWSVSSIPLAVGANTIDVRATDAAGNTSIDTIVVTLDTTSPTITITSPTSSPTHTTGASPVTLGGSAADAGGSEVASVSWSRLEGGGASGGATGTTNWSASIPLVPGSNTITVTVTDGAGNTGIDSITVTLNANAPTITITGPTSNPTYFTSASTLALSGSASDDVAVTLVEWQNNGGGFASAVGTTTWSVASISLSVGTNTIDVRASDGTLTGTDTITVIRDTTLPSTAITTNAGANFATNATPVLLAGTASDAGGSGLVSVTWNNAATSGTGPAAGTASWTASIPLTPGINVISITGTDGAGNVGPAVPPTITVTYDPTAPSVAITGPTSSPTLNTSAASTPLSGTSSDNVLVTKVEWRNNGGAFTDAVGTTSWSVATVALVAGTNVIDVRVTDSANNTSTDMLTITRDNQPPSIDISTNGGSPFTTNASPIVLNGTASDNLALASVTWSNAATGGSGTATGTSTWTASGIALAAGSNVITVTATDTLGNAGTDAITVTHDPTGPTVAITGPTSNPTHPTGTTPLTTLAGSASDNLSVALVQWQVNGGAFTDAVGTTSWSVASIALVAGANTITVRATDTAGNTSTDTITVTLDTTGPSVTIASPTSDPTYLTGSTPLAIGGTASDNASVTSVTWSRAEGGGASGTATGTTSWSATVPLVAGANTITVTATDSAGNIATDVLTVTFDDAIPTVAITTNTGLNFATNGSPTSLAGTASDPGGSLGSVNWANAATGGSGTATGTASWTASVPLAIGSNAITITATDSAGNNAYALITVTLDTNVPTVTITGPTVASTYVTSGVNVTLDGAASDNVGILSVAWVNSTGGSGSATLGAGTWNSGAISLAAGANVITITATDTALNTATDVITVTRDNTVPLITITSPTTNPTFLTGAATLPIGGTASDNVAVNLVEWRNNAGSWNPATGTTSWSASIGLSAGTNTIDVRATDSAGNFSLLDTITVTYDNGGPTVDITTNSGANFATNASPTLLAGTASDPNGLASVTWANAATGGSGTATGTAAWTASVPLAVGSNALTITATDSAGNTATDTITVTFDTSLPTVTITGPTSAPTFVTPGATIALDGTTSDNVGILSVAWSTNGAVVPNTGTAVLVGGTWSIASINLATGPQVITVTATDTANNISTDVITVTRDNTVPVITITSPTTNPTFLTGAATLLIGGTASDNVSVASVGWTHVESVTTGAASGTTSWSASIPLILGTNTIRVTATDTAGNVSVFDEIVVTRDTAAPSITITGPTPAATYPTNASPIALSGNASDAVGLSAVTWTNAATGGTGTATGTASWSASVPLAIGVNTITVTVIDSAGNTSPDSIDVTFDVTLPTVTISSPTVASTHIVSTPTIDLGGSGSDNVGLLNVTWSNAANSTSGTASGTTPWSQAGILLDFGSNVITVTATDTALNTSTDIIIVIRDGTLPTIAITSPTAAPTYVTNTEPITLIGLAGDNIAVAGVTWSRAEGGGASGTASGTGLWSASVPLVAGTNTITVTAMDAAGIINTDSITVTYDPTPPSIAINAPTALPTYGTNTAPILIGGTAADNGVLSAVTWSNSATGGTGTASGTATWSATIPLANGVNSIVVTATDTAGNTATDTLDVTFDAVVPSVTINLPTTLPTYITSAGSIGLGGTSTDNVNVASVSWANAANSTSGPAAGTVSWSVASISLAAGENLITVSVTDTAGNTAIDTLTVRQDSVPPSVAFTTPTSTGTFTTNTTPLGIGGTASDDVSMASVAWSNPAATASGTATGTSAWTASVPLVSGTNTITVTATDTAGNTAQTVLTVTLDSTPPTISPSGPGTFSTASASTTLSGTASDVVGLASVTWSNAASGGSGTATGTASWSAAIPLTPGTNVITVTVRDTAGNVATSTITVIHDTQAPTITLSTPTSAASYNSPTSPLTVGGNASDNVAVTSVTWTNSATGASGAAAGTASWSASIALIEGNNLISVTAVDDVGNTATDTITVSYDPTAPTINITGPTAAATYSTTTTPLVVSGTASDNLTLAGITWANTTTGSTGSASGTTVWNCSVPLASGSNTIVVTATDGVGTATTDTLTVIYDVTSPVVTIVSPPPPSLTTQTLPLAISGTAADNVGVTSVTWSNSLTGSSGTATFAAPNWNASINLIPGVNLITIRAADALGNIGTATLSVTYSNETTSPVIAIVSPAPPSYVSPDQLLTLTGTASDNVGVTTITWQNLTTRVYGTALGTTNWTAQVPLASGVNALDFTAWDAVGNSNTVSITITYTAPAETAPPTLSITAPTSSDTYTTTVSPLYIECDAIDDVGVVVVQWTNLGTYGDGASGWSTIWYASVPLVAGTNVITVTAVDTSGNTTTDSITVTYNPPAGDPVPPNISIVTPSGGTVNVSTPSISLAGTSADNDKVEAVTFANSATSAYGTATGTTAWSAAPVALNTGVNVITARAIDPAGNVGAATLVVVYTPPTAAKPLAPKVSAGHMCGSFALELLWPLGLLWFWRRVRRR